MEKSLVLLLAFLGISIVSFFSFFMMKQHQHPNLNITVIINEIDQQENMTNELGNIFLTNETIDESILPTENTSNVTLEINTSEFEEIYKIITEEINESEIDELII